MYRKILFTSNLTLRERLKRLVAYYFKKRGAKKSWEIQFGRIFQLLPKCKNPSDKLIEKEHKMNWKFLDNRINLATLRVSTQISGVSNPGIIPEEIFQADIEPTLNSTPEVGYLAFKSIYNRWFPGNIFPKDFLHNVDGEWLDQDLNSIAFSELLTIAKTLEYPVVIKPNRYSYGGKGVFFPNDAECLIDYAIHNRDFLVQEKIKQHPVFAKYHRESLNTIRIYIYRSVFDNKLHILNTVFRMGIGGNSIDNVTSGGIRAIINKDGYVNGFAVDIFGKKYYEHPDTQLDFNFIVPDWESLKKLSVNIAHKILYARLIGLDACYDLESNWRIIEINTFGATIGMAQNYGDTFFGEFTEEVNNYCKINHWALK